MSSLHNDLASWANKSRIGTIVLTAELARAISEVIRAAHVVVDNKGDYDEDVNKLRTALKTAETYR